LGIFQADYYLVTPVKDGEEVSGVDTIDLNVPEGIITSDGIIVEVNGPLHFNGFQHLNARTLIKEHRLRKMYSSDGSMKRHVIVAFDFPSYNRDIS